MASTVWRGFITFGVISIPVRLYRAARAERVGLRRLRRENPAAKFEDANEQEEETADRPVHQNQSRLTLVPKNAPPNPAPRLF